MPRLDGIDISHHQSDAGTVELGKVAAIPTWWFAAKATQSTSYVDPTFGPFWKASRPLFTHRLGYHWLSSTTDPVAQADWFLKVWDRTGGAMLDAEEGGITAAQCLAWCERVEDVTKRPTVVYSGLYVSGGTIWKSKPLRASQYGTRPFIVAAYVSEASLAARMIATGSQNFPHDAWQYSSNGPVDGIVGRCDMDQIDNRVAFDLACGVAAPNPQPPGDDEMIDIVRDAETSLDKFAVMPDGTLRPLSGTELKARKIANAVELGEPLTKAERDLLGTYMPAGVNPAALNALNDAVGRLGQNQEGAAHELDQVAAALRGDGH